MEEEADQMGLFGEMTLTPEQTPPAARKEPPTPRPREAKKEPAAKAKLPVKVAPKTKVATPARVEPPAKKVSGLVPVGDVRLTANIRQDLHLKLKIASAHRRTTIGEILEELIESYI
jgi:hypothetical protein